MLRCTVAVCLITAAGCGQVASSVNAGDAPDRERAAGLASEFLGGSSASEGGPEEVGETDDLLQSLADPDAGLTGTEDGATEIEDQVEDPLVEATGTIVAHAEAETVVAYLQPDDTADPIETFANPTEYGAPLVFQALGPPAEDWIEVLLPIRPNGTSGWVRTSDVELTINPYRIEIDASAYQLTVFRNDEPALSTTVAIGTGNTPTPLGHFYLVALLRPLDQAGPYGSYAYGLSGHSETLDSFNGGDGGIGIHGTNRPDLLGQDVSHGCIRVENETIEEMAEFLPLGTPVHIFRSDDSA